MSFARLREEACNLQNQESEAFQCIVLGQILDEVRGAR
jgi:hypothetical protein